MDSEDIEIVELEKKQVEIALRIAEWRKAQAVAEEAEKKAKEEVEQKAKEKAEHIRLGLTQLKCKVMTTILT